MSRAVALVWLALAPFPCAIAPAAAQPAQDGRQSPRHAAAYALAQELRDRDSMLFEISHAFSDSTLAQLAGNPALAALEKEHPGIIAHMFRASRSELEAITLERLPKLWAALAAIFASAMTDAEIAQTHAYYASAPGRRFKAAMLRNYDYSQELAPLAADIDAQVTPDAVRRGIVNGIGGTLAELSPEDSAALVAFSRTPAFAKLQALSPQLLKATTDWGNAVSPDDEARIAAAMEPAMEAFIAAGKKAAP